MAKKFISKKGLSISLILILLMAGFVITSWDDNDDVKILNDDDYETNYNVLLMLGLAPSTYSRQIEKNDIDTGIKLRDGDNIYSLIESRTFVTKDYGKSFLVRVA